MITIGSLFSGIGGFELGLERAIPNSRTIWQVEQNKFCQKVLKKHWPDAQIYEDITTINLETLPKVDIICGGFPCQDISLAGKQRGIHGKKSSLFFRMCQIIGHQRCKIAILENVPAIINNGITDVCNSLAEIGYDAEWQIISARQFGAPHLRKRWFLVAYPNSDTIRQQHNTNRQKTAKLGNIGKKQHVEFADSKSGASSHRNTFVEAKEDREAWRNSSELRKQPSQGIRSTFWQRHPHPSAFCRVDDGIPNRLARLRALGNAIVPQCSEYIGELVHNSGILYD